LDKNTTLMRLLSRFCVDHEVGDHTYVVGGAVRDFLLGRPIKDVDVVTDTVNGGLTSELLAQSLAQQFQGSTIVTNNYGVAILTLRGCVYEGVCLDGMVVEIANARKESYGGKTGKGYKPHMVEPASIQEDVVRREFRFNTLLWRMADIQEGPVAARVLDLTGMGLTDIREGQMVCPTDPNKVFTDDPTRMLRAVKFGLRLGFNLGSLELACIQTHARALLNVPPNAVAVILLNDIFGVDVREGLRMLEHMELLPVVREMADTNPAFRTTLTHWARPRVHAMLDLVEVGRLPVSGGLEIMLGEEGMGKLRLAVHEMDDPMALRFVEALRQPGKVMDTQKVAMQRGLTGARMGEITVEARNLLLESPSLFREGLTQAMLR